MDDLGDAGVGAVHLVDEADQRQLRLECLAKDEARLGQGALRGVDQQHGAVDHREPALDLAAEVGVPGSVDDVDLEVGLARPLQRERGVLGEDRDPALALLVARVHDALDDLLVGGECARLAQHRVDKGGLPVVDVGDDRDVPQLGHRGHATGRGQADTGTCPLGREP